ncbi:MAG: ATP synthase subunit I, partial [Microcystis panniformis]
MSDPSIESPPTPETTPPSDPMREYYQLQNTLLITTLILSGVIFIPVCLFYSLNTA